MEAGARIGQRHSSGRLRPGVIATVVPGAVLVGAAVGLAGHLIVGGTSAPGSSSAASASSSACLYPFATRFVADDLRTLAKVREG